MKLTIEVSDDLMKRVDHALKISEMSREEALDEALSTWVRHMPTRRVEDIDWDSFKGDPNFEGFDWIREEYCRYCDRPRTGGEK